MNSLSNFDFSFAGKNRLEFLEEAQKNLGVLGGKLGDGKKEVDAATKSASSLLQKLRQEVAELTAYPEVLPLEERHFTEHGLAVPVRFADLIKNFRFYWIRFPVTLWPEEGLPFTKLECALEFNPQAAEGHLRPLAQMILPDKKFAQQLGVTGSLNLTIGEGFEFEAAAKPVDLPAGPAGTRLTAGAEVKVNEAGNLGVIAGPFTYLLRKALINHSPPGAEKVFWRLSDARFLREDDPNFIVVLKVPRTVEEIEIVAGLQAYHRENLLAKFLKFFSSGVANFFENGAPTPDTKVWHIPPR